MAFNTNDGRQAFTATAAQTDFDFNFKIYADTDLNVYQNETLLTITAHYTVTIDGDNGGTVTLVSGATLNDAILLVRDLPATRSTDYQNGGDFLAGTIDDDQDYQTYLIADKELAGNQHLRLSEATQGIDTELPAPIALQAIRTNADANGFEFIAIGESDTYLNIANIDTIAELPITPAIETYNVRGYYAQNDGGGGLFNWDSTENKANANAITIIDPDETLENQGSGTGFGCWVRQTYSKSDSGSTLNYSIPTDFEDLQEALDIISEKKVPSNYDININIETGHALTSGFRIENIDLSFVTITSTDATVLVSPTMSLVGNTDLDGAVPRSSSIGFLAINAKMPKFDLLIDVSAKAIISAYELDHGSMGVFTVGAGIKNCFGSVGVGTNIRATTESKLHAYQSIFSGAESGGIAVTIGSMASVPECNFSNSGVTGIDVSRGSVVYAAQADCSGSEQGCYVRRSWLSANGVDFTDVVGPGVWAAIGSRVEAVDAIFDNVVGNSIFCANGSLVDVSGGLKNSNPLTPSDINLTSFNIPEGGGMITNDDKGNNTAIALTADTPTITSSLGSLVSVGASSYHTMHDVTGINTVYSGVVYSQDIGLKITVDGVVVLDDTGRAIGKDNAGNGMSIVSIPPIRSKASLKIEVYNRSTISITVGWKIYVS